MDLLSSCTVTLTVLARYKNTAACFITMPCLSLLHIYLMLFFRDLDNPFDYTLSFMSKALAASDGQRAPVAPSSTEVEVFPLTDCYIRIRNALLQEMEDKKEAASEGILRESAKLLEAGVLD
eukprot:TRINITY_DN13496_c0_g1_i8.p1 TRINITY_DN13496_c0_g1~~TRINITY_DN13496_c0_g1_i8.p1  ORF type:complete len:122 (-),score=42.61 TRINITY_DN13496_c0_g1_i8:339-704(-)